MRVIRQTNNVFSVQLSADELIELKRLSPHVLVSVEQVLAEIIVKGLLDSDESEPESEDADELEGTDEGIRGS